MLNAVARLLFRGGSGPSVVSVSGFGRFCSQFISVLIHGLVGVCGAFHLIALINCCKAFCATFASYPQTRPQPPRCERQQPSPPRNHSQPRQTSQPWSARPPWPPRKTHFVVIRVSSAVVPAPFSSAFFEAALALNFVLSARLFGQAPLGASRRKFVALAVAPYE